MDIFLVKDRCDGQDPDELFTSSKDTTVQLVIAAALGVSSFLAFCILRPRWKSLYAARKQQSASAHALPELPDTFFGWMPALWRVSEQQVLASAGLDAFVFLSFFKVAIRFLAIAFVLTAAIITPINNHFVSPSKDVDTGLLMKKKGHVDKTDYSYLWAYVVFTYLFTTLAAYLLIVETQRIIRVRQDYLGSQSTVTDRTIKLSGIPFELRSEDKIKEIVEGLEIGSVEHVTLCKNWGKLDNLMDERAFTLRKLEESWSVNSGKGVAAKNTLPEGRSSSTSDNNGNTEDAEAAEDDHLISGNNHITSFEQVRPTTKIRYGFMKLQSRSVDAIDYYEEKLRQLDEKVEAARKLYYAPTSLAFVTMDSIPACQMAVQALIDPKPRQLIASLAPAPSDIVWRNTYLPRSTRMMWSWSISIFVTILTIIWLIPVASMASLLNICTIREVWPQLGDLLFRHEIGRALVQTGLPTLTVSLLNVAVPYLYDWLSNKQGSISQSEVELSVISKNFAFTFFNFFLVFTVFGAATNIWQILRETAKDTTQIAIALAKALNKLAVFYTNFILLQGLGLFPLRLLQFGSVATYPITRMGAKTPRDFAELVKPGVFSYGFFLPTAILIFILCMLYSILPAGFMVLFFGLVYFVFGYFTYKYQLLYAMDHPQHATGRAWSMIVYRVFIGLGIFQLAMSGVIATSNQYYPAIAVLPLIPFTIWLSYFYGNTYEPLTKFIALRSIRREGEPEVNIAEEEIGIDRPPGRIRRGSTIDEDRERGQRFVNPSLTVPLEKLWIAKSDGDDEQPPSLTHEESTSSNVSYGDSNVWRQNSDNNV